MLTSSVHEELIVIDGNQINAWDREVLEELSAGGVTCAQVTCAVWEGARDTLSTLGHWFRRLREHEDLITLARSASDITSAKEAGKVAIVLGFQNASPFEDDLSLVEVFCRLGVRVVQLTYNIQNHLGGSCYEPNDSGLTRFGEFVVKEMNRCGMLVDLSHVGERTSFDAIEVSEQPVAITHANPEWFHPSPRNKSDELLKVLAESGGVLGCTVYPNFIGGPETRLEDFCAMIERLVEMMGVEHVAIGTDSTRKHKDEHLSWLRNGRWQFTDGEELPSWPEWPAWFRSSADFPNLTTGLLDRGFDQDEVAAVMGGNWLRLFDETFGLEE